MDRKQVANLVLNTIVGYDRVIVAPVLEDWVEGRAFRKEDRHRLLILADHLEPICHEQGVAELIEAVRGSL